MPLLTDSPWSEVRALDLPQGDYVIFGSAPLVAHGLLRQVGDVDIVARSKAWEKASLLAPPVLAPLGDQVIQLRGGTIEIFDGFLGLEPDRLINNAVWIEGLPFGHLSDVLRFKKLLRRGKDMEHIRLIEIYLRSST